MVQYIRRATLRLPDEKQERHATWLEIFFDLIFAVMVAQLSSRLMNQFNFINILQSSLLFLPLMWTWASYTVFAARFDNNDTIHWVMTFIIMIAGIIMAIQIPNALENGVIGFSIGFIIGQLSILFLYIRLESEQLIPHKLVHFYLVGFSLGVLCWIISFFFNSQIKFIFWILGMMVYLIFPWIGKNRILSEAPLDVTYIPERFGAFTIIILGQIIASVVFGLESTHWNLYSVITSVAAFTLAVVIFCQYYIFVKTADYKCTLNSGQPYIYIHIPLIIALILMGICTEKFIRSPITIDTNVNLIFSLFTIIYLISFYLLQYISIKNFKLCSIILCSAIILIILLFLFHPLLPYLTMTGLLCIFILLLSTQKKMI